MSKFIEFSLIGNNRGKTKVFFGILFQDGKGLVPNNGKEEETNAQRVLREDFGAIPTTEAEALWAKQDADTKAKADAEEALKNPPKPVKKAKKEDVEEDEDDEDEDTEDEDDEDTEILGDKKTTKPKAKSSKK